MATEVISTIRSSGGDYTSLSSWEAGEQGDLVSLDEIHTAECYNDWPSGLNDILTIDGSTTDSTRYMRVTVAAGHRHNGTPQTGFFMYASSVSARIVYNLDPYTQLEWVDIENTSSTGHGFELGAYAGVVAVCCIAKAGSSGQAFRSLLLANTVRNCLAWGGSVGFHAISPLGSTADNCGAANCATGWTLSTAQVLRNCWAYNNTTNYSGSASASSTNNATSSASDDAPGGSSVTGVASSDFANAAGNDFHLSSGSALRGTGTNLYSTFTTDIDGDTWPSSGAWDIGFDYYASAAAASAVPRRAFPRSILNH